MSIVKFPKISKHNIITTALLIISTILILSLATSPRFSCVRESECVVDCKTYDSLIAIANRPPKVDTVVVVDTVPGIPIIKYKDRLVPVYKDSLNTVYKDTLQTNDFRIITTDTLQWNELKYRRYDYVSYPKILFITKEVEKPVFVPQPYSVSHRGLYYGGTVGAFTNGALMTGDLMLITKKESYIRASVGSLGDITKNKLYPIGVLSIGKKF